MSQVILITGARSGFGLLGARTLAEAGHTVYGGLHRLRGSANNEDNKKTPIRDVVLDITSPESIEAAIQKILAETGGRLDCVIHNAGHMGMGPAESFSAEQYHQYYDTNAVGAHRLNQAVLPHMRHAGKGHLIWISSSSCRGGSGPLLAPYFAAKAGMHALALTLATEIACWGIETTLIVPGGCLYSLCYLCE
jgi:NAD(P)-dependent dehydrogenase (short-subunit alcohol dehydrogenase family)